MSTSMASTRPSYPRSMCRPREDCCTGQVVRLVDAVVAKARLRAMAILELVPANDPEGLGALTAGRIACNAVGALLRTRRD